MDIIFKPIGYIRSPYQTTKETPKWGADDKVTEAEIILNDEYLDGIADMHAGEMYQLIFHFHKSERFDLTVSKRGTGQNTGVFSSRSPHRPNAIGVSIITIKAVNKNRILFTGVDMLDGTPVLDIKSYKAN